MLVFPFYFELGFQHGSSLVVPTDRWYCKIVWSGEIDGRVLSTCLDEFM